MEETFRSVASQEHLDSTSKMNLPSTTGFYFHNWEEPSETAIVYNVLGISWTNLAHNLNESFSCMVLEFLALKGSTVNPNDKVLFQLYMYVYMPSTIGTCRNIVNHLIACNFLTPPSSILFTHASFCIYLLLYYLYFITCFPQFLFILLILCCSLLYWCPTSYSHSGILLCFWILNSF